ncbi:hypothetical protein ACFFX0_10280 [Citricoccus parietis]|uniref:Uncharacterized protein n=1 Tax=Citricoccus parietis TaxID=592307 RepID=A0ABV5FY03_9MICC
MVLGWQPLHLVRRELHRTGGSGHGDLPLEVAQRDHQAVPVVVFVGPGSRGVPVLEDPHSLVLEDDGVEVTVGLGGILTHGSPRGVLTWWQNRTPGTWCRQ